MNGHVVSAPADESAEVFEGASLFANAILSEEIFEEAIVEDLVADVTVLSGTLHLIFEMSGDTVVDEGGYLTSIAFESGLVLRHHGVNIALSFRKPLITQG